MRTSQKNPLLLLILGLVAALVLDGYIHSGSSMQQCYGQVIGDDDDNAGDDDDDDNAGDDDDDDDDDTTGDNTVVVGNLPAGVIVNAQGVLHVKSAVDPTGQLMRRRAAAAIAKLNPDVAQVSELRKISLNRLEKAVARRLAAGKKPTRDMRYLAGLTRIENVFFYPDTNDIVIAGPAEGYMLDLAGKPIGIRSGHSVLELQDLIVALRAFGPDGRRTDEIGCSIDPTQEGLARMQAFLSQIGGRALPRQTAGIVDGLQKSLGRQRVTVSGVSSRTHFAQVLVEADYRMKLIGIGLERPPVRIISYVQKANPAAVSRNALVRWYFVPDYDCVRVSDDGLAMQLIGDGVKLIGADELVRGDGTRVQNGRGDRASTAFVTSFTKNYAMLAQQMPVYAQLRNLIDLSIAAAYIQEQDYYSQADWQMTVFGDESVCAVETQREPQLVETAVNAIWRGRTLMTPIGGGVAIRARDALTTTLDDEDGQVSKLRKSIALDQLSKSEWWWD